MVTHLVQWLTSSCFYTWFTMDPYVVTWSRSEKLWLNSTHSPSQFSEPWHQRCGVLDADFIMWWIATQLCRCMIFIVQQITYYRLCDHHSVFTICTFYNYSLCIGRILICTSSSLDVPPTFSPFRMKAPHLTVDRFLLNSPNEILSTHANCWVTRRNSRL